MLKKIELALKNSFINYLSDFFILVMVISYLFTCVAMLVMATYSTIVNRDNSIWSDLGVLVGCLVGSGAGLWMIKNAVQHAIANKGGKSARMDFPKVDDTEIENEEKIEISTEIESETDACDKYSVTKAYVDLFKTKRELIDYANSIGLEISKRQKVDDIREELVNYILNNKLQDD